MARSTREGEQRILTLDQVADTEHKVALRRLPETGTCRAPFSGLEVVRIDPVGRQGLDRLRPPSGNHGVEEVLAHSRVAARGAEPPRQVRLQPRGLPDLQDVAPTPVDQHGDAAGSQRLGSRSGRPRVVADHDVGRRSPSAKEGPKACASKTLCVPCATPRQMTEAGPQDLDTAAVLSPRDASEVGAGVTEERCQPTRTPRDRVDQGHVVPSREQPLPLP